MEPMEASKQSNDPQEVIDLQDDHLVHRDEKTMTANCVCQCVYTYVDARRRRGPRRARRTCELHAFSRDRDSLQPHGPDFLVTVLTFWLQCGSLGMVR